MEYSATKCTLVTLISIYQSAKEKPIILRVLKQKEADICYRIGRTTPFRCLMLDYCDRMGFSFGTVRFTFDGSRIHATNTAQDLEMEDDDIIDAWTDQTGGGY